LTLVLVSKVLAETPALIITIHVNQIVRRAQVVQKGSKYSKWVRALVLPTSHVYEGQINFEN